MTFSFPSFLRQSEDGDFMLSLYNEYARLMYYTARQYAAKADSQEDIVQESLLHLIRNTSTLRTLDRSIRRSLRTRTYWSWRPPIPIWTT